MNIPPLVAEGLGLATQALSLAVPEIGLVTGLISAIQQARISGRPDISDADLQSLRDKIEGNQAIIDKVDDDAQANVAKTAG